MMIGKKKISEITVKKTAPVRLIKCYVCNKLFNSQPDFSLHLEQHQNKLNRTTVEELQRKTQESFRTKRQPSAITRKQSAKIEQNEKKEQDKPRENSNSKQSTHPEEEEKEEKEEEQELEDALKESQILLEKIDFLTQINEQPLEVIPTLTPDEDVEELHNIENEHQLYLQIRNFPSQQQAQSLILRTNFQEESFQNYQEQLKHLKNLSKVAVNPDSISKINSIANHITQDVIQELKSRYASIPNPLQLQKQKEIITQNSNTGEIRYCCVCYAPIEAGSDFLSSQFGSAYHKECLEEE